MSAFTYNPTLSEVQDSLTGANAAGTLLTPKHDPANLSINWGPAHTVISHELSSNLDSFFVSRQYTARLYENTRKPNSPIYIEFEPSVGSAFTVAGSGVPTNAVFTDTIKDRLIAVSGSQQAWHIFAEDGNEISRMLADGTLVYKGEIR